MVVPGKADQGSPSMTPGPEVISALEPGTTSVYDRGPSPRPPRPYPVLRTDAPAVAARATTTRRAERAGRPDPLLDQLVGGYRARCAALGSPPLERDVTRVARQVRELVVAGKPRPVIEVAIERAAQRNQPGLLTRYVGDIEREAAGNSTAPLRRRPTAGDQLLGRMTRLAALREGSA